MRSFVAQYIKCANDGMFASLLTQSSRQVYLALAMLCVNMSVNNQPSSPIYLDLMGRRVCDWKASCAVIFGGLLTQGLHIARSMQSLSDISGFTNNCRISDMLCVCSRILHER